MGEKRAKATFIEYHPFFDCCRLASERLRRADEELGVLERSHEDDGEDQIGVLKKEIGRLTVSAPIFGAITLEAFINHYAEVGIDGDAWRTQEEVDALSIQAKWVVVPYLACGAELDIKSDAYKEFKDLIGVRNALVHSKPVRIYELKGKEHYEQQEARFDNKSRDRRRVARRADVIVTNIVSELLELDERPELRQLIDNFNITLQ